MTPEDHSSGPTRCEQLGAFVDGELTPDEATAFRRHLVVCARCQQEMHGLMQLSALAEQARERRPAEAPQLAPAVIAAMQRGTRPRRAAWVAVVGTVAIAASLALFLVTERRAPTAATLLASRDVRRVSGWPSYAGEKEYRPYSVQRGNAADVVVVGVSKLEERQDWAGLASVALVRGEFKQAMAYLQRAPKDARTQNDIGLALLELGQPEAALEAFAAAEKGDPTLPQPGFNRALALERMGLPRAAKAALEGVLPRAPGGWRAEAQDRIRRLDAGIARRQEDSAAMSRALKELVEHQTPPDSTWLTRAPASVRSSFYRALALAPDAATVQRIRPLAVDVDRLGDKPVLATLVDRVLAHAGQARWPLAAELRPFALEPGRFTLAQRRPLWEKAVHAGQKDQAILLSSFDFLDTTLQFPRLAEESSDPFWRLRLLAADVRRARNEGRPGPVADEARSRTESLCQDPSVGGECALVFGELALLELARGRPEQALAAVKTMQAFVPRAPDATRVRTALLLQAEILSQSDRVEAARGIWQDVVAAQPEDCALAVYLADQQASAYIGRGDAAGARSAFTPAPACRESNPDPIYRMRIATQLAMLEGTEAARREASHEIDRADRPELPAQSRRDVAIARAILLAESGDAGAADALRAVEGGHVGVDPRGSDDDLALAQTSLVFWNLGRNAPERALELLGKLGQAAVPERCALGAAAQFTRRAWIVKDAGGRVTAFGADTVAPERLPAAARGLLRQCDGISVLASAQVLGRPELLDPDLAWSYATSAAPFTEQGAFASRLRVRRPVTPPELGLPALEGGARDGTAGWTVLEGAEATPPHVRSAMQRADVIDLEVHGVVRAEMPDGAMLVLSPSPQGYALTAPEIESTTLSRRPVVFLGACHAAAGSPFRFRPWNMPVSFVRAGARAVFASVSELPDAEVGSFFSGVGSRLETGLDPKRALRDERKGWLARGATWVNQVVLFE
jgi:tetratricopeptide (TPR) repeat protein